MTNNTRQEKGKEIAEKNDLHRVDQNTYRVRSQSKNKVYNVVKTNNGWICDCPDHIFRKVCCKHIHAVEFSIRIRKEVREKNKVVIQPITVSACLFCHSKNIKKFGIRHNKSGDIQRFVCSYCNKTFSINLGFEKMKHSSQAITSAMQLYFTGESLRNVQKFLRLQGAEVSHVTIYKWVRKYAGLMQQYLDKIIPQVGDVWRADEVYVKVRGNMKYVFSLMDDETRFWIAQEVADSKYSHDARTLFRKGKQVTQTKPRVLITDGLQTYKEAYLKEFRTQQLETKTTHIRHIRFKGDMNNNKMERLNGEFRDREKVVRGIKKKDSVLIDGYQMYHNYLRPHMSLDGLTPADKAGIKIEGQNKWITLIQNSSQIQNSS